MNTRPVTAVMVSIDKDLLDLVLDDPAIALAGLFDPAPVGGALGIAVLGSDSAWPSWSATHPDVRVILAVDPPKIRARLADHYGRDVLLTVIAPDAHVSKRAQLGRGVIIQRRVTVSADTFLGDCVKLNVGASVHHDCRIGDFVTIAPGARLLGSVEVGERAYIGSGATVLQGVRIGANAVIGAGAVVTRDIPPGCIAMGMPARPKMD